MSAIWLVSRSCTCSRRANTSTSRGILLRPITLAVRNVGDVALAEERQQVMLAQAVEVDVLDDHHLAIIDREQRVVQHLVDVGAAYPLVRNLHAFSTRFGVSDAAPRGSDLRRVPSAAA